MDDGPQYGSISRPRDGDRHRSSETDSGLHDLLAVTIHYELRSSKQTCCRPDL